MAGITGIGSNMDIDAMVGGLVAAQSAPKQAQLARLEKTTTAQISAVGQLNGALSSFQSALKSLNDPSLFEKRSATSSNSGLVTASASSAAQKGSYSLRVEQLATGSKTATKVLDTSFNAGAGGTLNVRLGPDGEDTAVKIDAGASLTEIRDALNTQLKDQGISANLLSNPSDGKTRLVLTSSVTGVGKDVQVSTTDSSLQDLGIGSASLSADDPDSSGVLEASANAKFTIDGLALESETNTVDGAVPDVVFTLVAADKDKTVTVKVAQDQAGVTSNIKKFVDAYNSLISTTDSLTTIVKVGEGKEPVVGALVGDASVRGLLSSIRSEMVSAGEGSIKVLAELGITTQKDGTLAIDDAKLKTALDNNIDAVGTLFTGDKGLMTRLEAKVSAYAASDGILSKRISSLNVTLNGIDEQREVLTQRTEKLKERLYAQFNAMDSLVGQLLATSDRLSQTFDSLPGIAQKKK